jgi:hypothetical protein
MRLPLTLIQLVFLSAAFGKTSLPVPTGAFPVGLQVLLWNDPARPEDVGATAGKPREIADGPHEVSRARFLARQAKRPTFVNSMCMRIGEPSRTAHAAHQVLDHGRIFSDPLALRILGAERKRFAEAALASAFERGVRQLVVLGAGLDTYAYRGALRDRLRVFEVDHPATRRA